MYDELVKRLRHDSESRALMVDAADAIEELSREYGSIAVSLNESVELVRKLQQPRWIPVTERLPEEDGKYLVRYVRDIDLEDGVHSDEVRIMRFANAQWRFPFICNSDVRKLVTMETVTHWMPLPEPPKEEE